MNYIQRVAIVRQNVINMVAVLKSSFEYSSHSVAHDVTSVPLLGEFAGSFFYYKLLFVRAMYIIFKYLPTNSI